jgi:hypothetical protein
MKQYFLSTSLLFFFNGVYHPLRIRNRERIVTTMSSDTLNTTGAHRLANELSANVHLKNGQVHPDIVCNNCKQDPISGVRFKCVSCPDVDLCLSCYINSTMPFKKGKFEHDRHQSNVHIMFAIPSDYEWNRYLHYRQDSATKTLTEVRQEAKNRSETANSLKRNARKAKFTRKYLDDLAEFTSDICIQFPEEQKDRLLRLANNQQDHAFLSAANVQTQPVCQSQPNTHECSSECTHGSAKITVRNESRKTKKKRRNKIKTADSVSVAPQPNEITTIESLTGAFRKLNCDQSGNYNFTGPSCINGTWTD